MSMILDGSNGVTFNDASLQGAAASPYVLKNRIINGAMVIDQRNAGATMSPVGTSAYMVDRWQTVMSQSGKFNAQQNQGSITPPVGFSNYLGLTVASAATIGASDYFSILQKIEGFNTADLSWGTANAQTVTLSFRVYSSLTGSFSGAIENSANNRSYPFSYAVSSANTWTTVSVTIPGDTTGTWVGATNGVGMGIWFDLGCGSSFRGTANTWAGAQYIGVTGTVQVAANAGATFYITGVQLEIGTSATPFERRLYNQELANCQRYAIVYGGSVASEQICMGQASSATSNLSLLNPPVTMRIAPSLSVVSASGFLVNDAAVQNATSAVVIGGQTSSQCFFINSTTSGITAGRATRFMSNTTSDKITFSAEL